MRFLLALLCPIVFLAAPPLRAQQGSSQPEDSSSSPLQEVHWQFQKAFWIGFGFGGSIKHSSSSLVVPMRYWNIGLAIGLVSPEEPLPDYLAHTPPHSDVVPEQFSSGYIGFDLRGYLPFDRLSFFGSAGIYGELTATLLRSRATGWYYFDQEQSDNWSPAFGGGAQYTVYRQEPDGPDDPVGGSIDIGLEYHTVRGISVEMSVGILWSPAPSDLSL